MYHYDRGECQTHSSLLWLLRGERRGEEREPKLSFRPEESKGEKEEKGLRQTAARQSPNAGADRKAGGSVLL